MPAWEHLCGIFFFIFLFSLDIDPFFKQHLNCANLLNVDRFIQCAYKQEVGTLEEILRILIYIEQSATIAKNVTDCNQFIPISKMKVIYYTQKINIFRDKCLNHFFFINGQFT